MPRRVAIVEDHLLLAETMRTALAQSGLDVRIVAPDDPERLLSVLLDLRPGLALVDLDLGEYGDSTAMIGRLSASGVRVLVVTGTQDRLRIAAALEQGAIGYQHKAAGFDALLARTTQAIAGGTVITAAERAELLAELEHARGTRERQWAPFLRLTQRERDALAELARGRSVADIARDWVVSEATVRTHVRALLRKLNVPSQLAAVAMAVRSGWLRGNADR